MADFRKCVFLTDGKGSPEEVTFEWVLNEGKQ